MSNGVVIVIIAALLVAGRVAYVVRRVRRDRRRPSLPGTADAYEGSLIVPAAGSRHRAGGSGQARTGHHGTTGGRGGIGGHGAAHPGPAGHTGSVHPGGPLHH